MRRQTHYIVIHCAATRATMDVGRKEIDQWHKARGWNGIGYHFVIRRNGLVERGRPENAIGSHVAGHNSNSIGICLVGGLGEGKGWPPEDNFTPAQWAALQQLCAGLVTKYPGATILGHRDFPGVNKACPSFDARKWARNAGLPVAPDLKVKATTPTTFAAFAEAGNQGLQEGAAELSANAQPISEEIGAAQETLVQISDYVSWAGYCLRLIAIALALYAGYRIARIGVRWARAYWAEWRAQRAIAAEDVMPALPPPTSKRKRNGA